MSTTKPASNVITKLETILRYFEIAYGRKKSFERVMKPEDA